MRLDHAVTLARRDLTWIDRQVTNEVYVPIKGNNATTPAGTGAVCNKGTDVFGNAGSDALGCILTHIAPCDGDDH